jgi:hypothetical protein
MDNYLVGYKELYKWVLICFLKLLYVMNICDFTQYGTWEHWQFIFCYCC